ncbi:MAG: hypothetical protein EON85_07825 [Brevundimonas sp.]|nr:MAG: hypothetical protein EON85_07825 [Brevundimonas sp.]
MMGHLQQAQAFEEADDLFEAAKHYALAYDQEETADDAEALRAALTFFEAKDNLPGRIAEDEYLYFERWIDRAAKYGSSDAAYWKAYDAMIYGDGADVLEEAHDWHAAGSKDALLTLSTHLPERFAEEAKDFTLSLRRQRTYRERYLYSILGHRFDSESA